MYRHEPVEEDEMVRMACGRGIRCLALSALIVAAAACTGSNSGPSSANDDTPSATDAGNQASAPPAAAFQQVKGNILGGGDVHSYTATMPGTWTTDGGAFMVNLRPDVMGLSVWNVGRVPRDPCRWKNGLTSPGPTVDDLTTALTSQRLRDASAPTPVTLGGYHGTYLEMSVPTDSVVTGDADFEGCDDPGNGHSDFVSWFGVGGDSERYARVAGQIERVWILDVNGQRLVVDGIYSPDAMPRDIAQLEQVAASIHFDPT